MCTLIVLPALYGSLGFLVAVIAAWLYNLAAGAIGGIELEVKEPRRSVVPG